ncbi:MAG: ADP-ribosylglycohydrolase family protein [Lentisphaeria bacterium]|nr:ADP-ribosylglycohydrolase family protein [Lentisphaeria bacterium]
MPDAKETLTAIKNARRANSIQELGEGWVAEEALAIGIFCALKHTWDFKAGVIEAININGDSDSTGAITGNILGILNGENGIPQQWCQNLREYSLVSRIADDLIQKIEKNPEDHVTKEWWEKYPGF